LILSYYILIIVARGGVWVSPESPLLKTILDIAYPLGDFVGLTVSVVVSSLSFKYLGGGYKYDIIAILGGLAMMFVADSLFSYTTTTGSYYNGSFTDLAYIAGLFLLSFGILGFGKLKNGPVAKPATL
jgi:hypothetical protein